MHLVLSARAGDLFEGAAVEVSRVLTVSSKARKMWDYCCLSRPDRAGPAAARVISPTLVYRAGPARA